MEFINIRNIDNQGRIIIPCDIRKRLNITGGDSLEIISNGQDILLRKCNAAMPYSKQLQTFLTILYEVVKHGAFICNTEAVCMAKGVYLPDGSLIPEELSTYVEAGQETIFNLDDPIYILPHIKEPVTALFPIPNQEDYPLALVLLCKHGKPLSEMELGSAKLVATTLAHKFM